MFNTPALNQYRNHFRLFCSTINPQVVMLPPGGCKMLYFHLFMLLKSIYLCSTRGEFHPWSYLGLSVHYDTMNQYSASVFFVLFCLVFIFICLSFLFLAAGVFLSRALCFCNMITSVLLSNVLNVLIFLSLICISRWLPQLWLRGSFWHSWGSDSCPRPADHPRRAGEQQLWCRQNRWGQQQTDRNAMMRSCPL